MKEMAMTYTIKEKCKKIILQTISYHRKITIVVSAVICFEFLKRVRDKAWLIRCAQCNGNFDDITRLCKSPLMSSCPLRFVIVNSLSQAGYFCTQFLFLLCFLTPTKSKAYCRFRKKSVLKKDDVKLVTGQTKTFLETV